MLTPTLTEQLVSCGRPRNAAEEVDRFLGTFLSGGEETEADRQVESETGGGARGGGGVLMGLSIFLLLSIHTDKDKDVFL